MRHFCPLAFSLGSVQYPFSRSQPVLNNEFLDGISFGGPVLKSGDPVEQEKRIKGHFQPLFYR